jgi:large subunit ribosomal protein L25
MSSEFTLEVQARTDIGKGASRRLRRLEGRAPGIIYGGAKNKKPVSITFADNEMVKLTESEAFFTSLITLKLDGKEEQVVIKDMQRHPAKNTIMHADFLRVSSTTKITMHVPLHFINVETCPGVKTEGGVVAYTMQDIEISCLPKNLPEFIEVDLAEAVVGTHVHISDISLPAGVESVALIHGADHDLQIAAISIPRGGSDEEETEEAADDDAATEEGSEEAGDE